MTTAAVVQFGCQVLGPRSDGKRRNLEVEEPGKTSQGQRTTEG